MKRQRLYPVPAGAVLPRDVRVLHGGTPNFSQEVRFLPSILLCSGAAAAAGRFKQDWPTLPRQLFDTLRSDVQELCEDVRIRVRDVRERCADYIACVGTHDKGAESAAV